MAAGRKPKHNGRIDRAIARVTAFSRNPCYALDFDSGGLAMTDWVVVYRTSLGVRETRSPSAPTERRALAQARTLHMQGCEILRILGPGDSEVSEQRLNLWIANGRDRLDLAE
jgi:hypothetical protein